MGFAHLEGSTLISFLRGHRLPDYIERHVRSCDICRARLRDERLRRVLLAGGESSETAHVDEDKLTAYLDQRLTHDDMDAVDRHLAGCDVCLAEYLELRRLVDSASDRAVPAHLTTFALATLGTRTLGTLYVNLEPRRVVLFYLPDSAFQPQAYSSMESDTPRSYGVKASESRRMLSRINKSASASIRAPDEKVQGSFADYTPPEDSPSFEHASHTARRSDPVAIPVDDELELELLLDGGILTVTAREPSTGAPREQVLITLEYDGYGTSENSTDSEGRTVFKAPSADVPARLLLAGPPRRAIDIQVV